MREADLPFRTAHHIVSSLVSRVTELGLTPNDITADLLAEVSQGILPEPLRLSPEVIQQALDPVAFVQVRTTLGGAAPSATAAVLEAQAERLAVDKTWLNNEQQRLTAAAKNLDERVVQILSPA